jgi:Flp pilus assembly protein TadD
LREGLESPEKQVETLQKLRRPLETVISPDKAALTRAHWENIMNTCFRLTGIGVLVSAALLAQGREPGMGSRVRGEISPLPAGTASLTVELSGNGSAPLESVPVGPDGTFEFHFAQPGSYELRIVAAGGGIVHQETVLVSSHNQLLSIRLTDTSPAGRSSDGTVSIQQLTHKVPAPARKAFEKGAQAETKGQYDAAAGFFRQAVSLDPEYAGALSALGAMEAKQGDLPHAAEDLRKAVNVVPDYGPALSNLSIVLSRLQRFDESAAVARRALRVMPASATLRFVLATSLLSSKGDSDEVLDNLERSAADIPRAHLVAAQLLARRGRRPEAAQHVEDYLRAAPPDDRERERAKAILAELHPE